MKKFFYLLKNIIFVTLDYIFLFIGLNLLLSGLIVVFYPWAQQVAFVLGILILMICIAIGIGNCILQIKIGKELFKLNPHPYRGIVFSLVTLYLVTVFCCVMNKGFIDFLIVPGYVICNYIFNLAMYIGIGSYVFCFLSSVLYFAPFLFLLIGTRKNSHST